MAIEPDRLSEAEQAQLMQETQGAGRAARRGAQRRRVARDRAADWVAAIEQGWEENVLRSANTG